MKGILNGWNSAAVVNVFFYGLIRILWRILPVGLVFLNPACTEVYDPELETGNNILYIEGGITDAAGPHTLMLRYTAGYNDRAEFVPASGAEIMLYEEEAQATRFQEMEAGVYKTDSVFHGTPGNTYRLFIRMPDGHTFESKPQILPVQHSSIDSVYGLKEVRKVEYYNVYGEFILREEEVNQIYADIPSTGTDAYYRFETQLVLEHASAIVARPESNEPDMVDLYMWDSFFPGDLVVVEVNDQRDKLRKFPLSHAYEDNEAYSELKYAFFPDIDQEYSKRIDNILRLEVETDSGRGIRYDSTIYGIPVIMNESDYFYGWILRIKQFSITRDAFTFWTDIQRLEESGGEIFDPIATQLRGNMRCAGNEELKMLGLFEVASQRETTGFINYLSYRGIYKGSCFDIPWTFAGRGWHDTIPPGFWIEKLR